MLQVEGFGEALRAQVALPDLSEADMLPMKWADVGVVEAGYEAAPLFTADVVVAKVEVIEIGDDAGEAQFKTHLRVAHKVAVLFAKVCDRQGREATRPGSIQRLDDQRQVGAVVDGEGEAGVPTPRLF